MKQTSPDHLVLTKVIQDEVEWDSIREKWDGLYAASPTASTALDFAWLRAWWRVYKPTLRVGGLRVVTIWRSEQLIGAMPLFICCGKGGPLGLRRLGLISTGEAEFEETCADYLNILYAPDDEVLCVESIWQAVGQMDWDHLELLDLPENTPLLGSRCVPSNVRRFSRGKCPVADLSGGFEAYLQQLSPNRRQQARRLMREGERAGMRFEIVGVGQVGNVFDDLIKLHQARWNGEGKPGVFGAPRFVEFHRDIIAQWLPVGRVVLAQLSLATEPVVILYGFVTGQKFDFYQSGVRLEPSGQLRSPGNLAHLLLMQILTDRGVTAYDFLRGSSTHKERQATRRNELIGIEIWRPSLRTTFFRLIRLFTRILRKGLRVIRTSMQASRQI